MNIRLGWEGLPGTNTLAYWAHLYVTKKKKVFLWIAAQLTRRKFPGDCFKALLLRHWRCWEISNRVCPQYPHRDKRSSLFCRCYVIDKALLRVTIGIDPIKLFYTHNLQFFCNKLECLSLANLSSLVYCSRVRPGAYPRVEQLKGASRVGCGLTCKHYTMLERLSRYKRSSLWLITKIRKLRPLKVL